MSERASAYDQHRSQKEFARLQRRMQGADTRRDKAEVRHEAIGDFVHGLRYWAPLILAGSIGWIGPFSSGNALVPAAIVLAAFVAAKIIANLSNILFRWLWPLLYVKTENLVLQVCGAGMAVGGFQMGWPGMAASGIALASMPTIWRWWARRVMARTDFARMRASEAAETRTGIVE